MHIWLPTLMAALGIWAATSLGAATVLFLKKTPGETLQNTVNGFSAGVMLAASVWSLLLPAIEMRGWPTALAGTLCGAGSILAIDKCYRAK